MDGTRLVHRVEAVNNGNGSWKGFPETKRCGGCGRIFPIAWGVTFTRNNSRRDGKQIYCRECDERHKAEDPNYAWGAFQRAFGKEHPADLAKWTRESYLELVCGKDGLLGECNYCGNSLKLWGKGHKIDRIDSMRGHVPDNCVPCCSGCNRAKGSMNPEAWAHYLKEVLERYPWGKVPWQAINPKGPRPVVIPDLAGYAIATQLPLFKVA